MTTSVSADGALDPSLVGTLFDVNVTNSTDMQIKLFESDTYRKKCITFIMLNCT